MHFMRAIGWFMDGNEWWQLRSCLRAAVGGRKGSRVRDGWEADKTAPPAFPNAGHGQRFILQFTMPLALRLVNDTLEYVVRGRERLERVPAKSARCQKFLLSRFLPCLELVRWDQEENANANSHISALLSCSCFVLVEARRRAIG